MDGSRSVGILIRGDKKSSLEMLGLIGGPTGSNSHDQDRAFALGFIPLLGISSAGRPQPQNQSSGIDVRSILVLSDEALSVFVPGVFRIRWSYRCRDQRSQG